LNGCEIKALPSDLFVHTPNLEVIYFGRNKIDNIGEDLLEPLKNLKFIDFTSNVSINCVYDEDKVDGLSLDELKRKIRENCGGTQNGDLMN
jgi:Leucine rich repeat